MAATGRTGTGISAEFFNAKPEADFEHVANRDVPGGYATLDSGGKIASFQLEWVSNTGGGVYTVGALVAFAGNLYKNLTGTNTDTNPSADATNWLIRTGGELFLLSYSESKNYKVGEVATVFGIPFANKIAVTTPEVFVPAKWTCLDRTLRTGVISGGDNWEIDGTDPTKINITGPIQYLIVETTATEYVVSPLTFPATAGITNAKVLTDRATHIYLSPALTVFQSKKNTYEDMIDNAYLGFTENDASVAFNQAILPITAYSGNQIDIAQGKGLGGQVLDAFRLGEGSTGLTLDVINAGTIYANGVGYVEDIKNPDIASIPLASPLPTIRRVWEINGALKIDFTSSNVIDPSKYNPGELSLDPVPANHFTVQRVYLSGAGQDNIVYYGRTSYPTKDEAIQSFNTSDEFAENGDTRGYSAFAGWIIIQEGTTDWTDPDRYKIINACQTTQTIGRGRPSGSINFTESQIQSNLAGKSTGVFSGGGLSGTLTETTFSIAAGTGQVIDNTVPGTTTEDPYEWDAFVDVALTELATAKHTFVFLKKVAGVVTVVQIGDDSVITEIDRKKNLYLGVIRHGPGTFVGAISQPQTVVSPVNKLIDFYIATGKVRLSSGNEITATGAGLLTVDKGLGKSFGIGVNAFNDGNNTDFVDNPAIAAASMLKYSSVGHIDGSLLSDVDTSRYDPNGATTDSELVALVGGTTRVVHRIWVEAVSNLVIFQYGQASYANVDDARAQWMQEDLSLPTGLNESSYLREVIIVQNGDLNLDTAVFIPVEGVGGSGGQVQPTNVIDNLISTDPNSALSANQGRVLNLADVASGAVVGKDVVLTLKDASVVTVTNGAATFANSDLTFDASHIHQMSGFALLIFGGTNLLFTLDEVNGPSISFDGNKVLVGPNGVELSFDPTDDLKIEGNAGTAGQVITSAGPALPPTWGSVPAAPPVLYDQVRVRVSRSSFNDDPIMTLIKVFNELDVDVVNGIVPVSDPGADVAPSLANAFRVTDGLTTTLWTLSGATPFGQQTGFLLNLASPQQLKRLEVNMFNGDTRNFFDFEVWGRDSVSGDYIQLLHKQTLFNDSVSDPLAVNKFDLRPREADEIYLPRVIMRKQGSVNNSTTTLMGSVFPMRPGCVYKESISPEKGFGIAQCRINPPSDIPGTGSNRAWHYIEFDGLSTNIDTGLHFMRHEMGSTITFNSLVTETLLRDIP